jgi:hypothetical protein
VAGPSVVALMAINFKDRMYTGKDAFICSQRPDRNMSAPLSADLADPDQASTSKYLKWHSQIKILILMLG